MKILCIYYDYWQNKNLKNIYNKGVHFKSNPRSFRYLENILKTKLDDFEILTVKFADDLKNVDFDSYEKIILLYPDSIGLGWEKIENAILKNVNEMKDICIINGRGRTILFNKLNLSSLRLRRVLERFLLGEVLFSLYFILVTPFLLVKDLLNGKK